MSFLDRFHRDVQALTGSTEVLEHSPSVLDEVAKERYAAAHLAHVTRMHGLDKPVDEEFWPHPECAVWKEENDGDTDDHLCLPSHSSCR